MTLFLVIQCLRIQDADHQRRFYRSVQIGHSRFPDQIVQVLRTARLWIYLSLRLGKTIELHWLGFMLDRLVAVNLLNHPRNRGIELQPTDHVGASRWLLPRTNGVGTEPTPESGAADLGDHAWSDHLLADIGQGQARERQPEAMRQLTGEGFTCTTTLREEKRAGRPPRDCSSRRGRRASAYRLRHLLTIWRGVSRRAAMTSLERPWAATILALMTSRYGDVYLHALVSSWFCSSLVRMMRNGLGLGRI